MLDEIEREALDQSAPLAGALRKCVALGGRSGSRELRDWASKELSGYNPADNETPAFRTVPAVLKIDGANLHYRIRGQTISPAQLPEVARDSVQEQVTLYQGVGELEALVQKLNTEGGVLALSFHGSSDLAAIMNSDADYGTTIHRVYHEISTISVVGILDRVRTALVELVAELRDGYTNDDGLPTVETASQAISVAVHGRRNRVQLVNTQAGTSIGAHDHTEKDPWWKRWQVVSALVAGAAGLTTAGIALVRVLAG